MVRGSDRASRLRRALPLLAIIASAGLVAAFTGHPADPMNQEVSADEILRGRQLVLEHACGACHGGMYTPDAEGWLIGLVEDRPQTGPFPIGACATEPGAEPCFLTRPRNLTPDNLTGLGRFTERQIFNALRFGLRPGETPDVEITSTTPGEGNFPANPKYLAPPMPWMAWRHMPDDDLWAIAAYLEHGVKPVRHRVLDSDGPPDFWASGMTAKNIGPYPAAGFPTAHEVRPTDPTVDMDQVLRGRQVVIQHDCGACHGGPSPLSEGWLAGVGGAPRTVEFPIGPCVFEAGAQPCWMQRARNLTPHETTGTGRYTDRQLFNALRYGLRPSTTPDVVIESDTPGRGHFPLEPDYLGLGMPWPAWRYMSHEDLWAVVAYLKHAVRPVDNEVPASDAPPDLWASEYTVEKIGPYPAPPYPTANEVAR